MVPNWPERSIFHHDLPLLAPLSVRLCGQTVDSQMQPYIRVRFLGHSSDTTVPKTSRLIFTMTVGKKKNTIR